MKSRVFSTGIGVAVLALVAAVPFLSSIRAAAQEAPKQASVSAVDGKALKKALEDHKGKVVVLNFWATWCGPCVDEFPDLVKLHDQYADKGLVVLGVSMDEPDDLGKVVDFAQKQKAGFPIFVRKNGSIEKYVTPIDKGWQGVIPTTYIYDRAGKRVGKPLVGLKSYDDFVKAVEPLLPPAK